MKTRTMLLAVTLALAACAPTSMGPQGRPPMPPIAYQSPVATGYDPAAWAALPPIDPGPGWSDPNWHTAATVTRGPPIVCRTEGLYDAHYGVNPLVRRCYEVGPH